MDRDLNASLNIKKLCINKLNNTVGQTEFQACGLVVRPNISSEILANEVEAGNYLEAV